MHHANHTELAEPGSLASARGTPGGSPGEARGARGSDLVSCISWVNAPGGSDLVLCISGDAGKAFVTDGGFALDAAIAKPATLPQREWPGKALQDYLDAAHEAECRLNELTAAASGKTYSTPTGIAINATCVRYLGRVLPPGAVRLRMSAPGRQLIVVVSGKAVGVLMPVAQ